MRAARPNSSRYKAAAARLRELYWRRGQLRAPDKTRCRKKGRRGCRHGYELRFRTYGDAELAEVQRLLHTVGIPTGRPYPVSSSGTAVSVYGEERTLAAVRHLRLRRPPVRVTTRRPKPRPKAPPRLRFTTLRQLEVAMLMYDRVPLTALKIGTTPRLLAEMERHRLVKTGYNWHGEKTWVLTRRGEKQTRRGRRAYRDWRRSAKPILLLNRQWLTRVAATVRIERLTSRPKPQASVREPLPANRTP